MNKIQNLKKQARDVKQGRIVLWAVIFTLIALQVISAWYITKLWDYKTQDSKRNLYSLINNSEERRYKYPVIDIAESRVYIPEAHVYVPLNEVTRDLRYNYVTTPSNKLLQLSTSSLVGSQNESDDPSCDRVVTLSQSKELSSTTYYNDGEIQPTKDGLRYLLIHNKNTCSIYQGNIQENLAKSAKLITQY